MESNDSTGDYDIVRSTTINTEDIISRLQQFAASLESELDDVILGSSPAYSLNIYYFTNMSP